MNAITLLALWLAIAPLVPVNQAGLKKVISSQKGKIVVVNMWASWCAPCRNEMPALVALEKRHPAGDFKLILVSANELEEEKAARKFLETVEVSSGTYIKQATDDQKFIDSVDPKWNGALPATFVYDRSGKRVKSFFGEVDIHQLESLIKTL